MHSESNIFDKLPLADTPKRGFYDFKLLKTTAHAALYLAFKAGKRFLIKTTKDNSEWQLRMLHREYELSIGCTHPHLVGIYTIEEELPVGQGIVMEYIEGRTLDSYLAENPPKRERNRIFSELLSAVGYLHKRGIIHNDIKPENILITHADNTLKLLDFGLADSDAEYLFRRLGCTPRYASPELRAQSQTIDARSDIYAIGLIMAELLGGSAISRRCTNQQPEARYANIEALSRAWRSRNRSYYIVAAVVLLILLLTPSLVIFRSRVAQQRRELHRQQLTSELESRVGELHRQAADSIAQSRYIEFATMHATRMQERCREYLDSLTADIENQEIKMALAMRYSELYDSCWRDVVKRISISELPSYHLETPPTHWRFYDSLIEQRSDYRPFPFE